MSGNGQKELAETVCGVRTPSDGRLLIGDLDVTGAEPEELDAAGMGRIPEDRHAGVIGDLTVAENAALEHLGEFTKQGIVDRDSLVVDTCVKRGIPVVMTLGGGYSKQAWAVQHASIRRIFQMHGTAAKRNVH